MVARKHVFNLGGIATQSQEMGFMFMAPTVSSHFTRKLTSPTLGNGKSSSKVPLGWDMLVPRMYIVETCA